MLFLTNMPLLICPPVSGRTYTAATAAEDSLDDVRNIWANAISGTFGVPQSRVKLTGGTLVYRRKLASSTDSVPPPPDMSSGPASAPTALATRGDGVRAVTSIRTLDVTIQGG